MRKFLCVLLSLILTVTVFCACSKSNETNESTYSNDIVAASSERESKSESTLNAVSKQSTTEKTTEKNNKDKKETTKKSEKASTSAKAAKNKNDKKVGTTKKPSSNDDENGKTTKVKALLSKALSDDKNETVSVHTSSSQINCSITIECKSILDNMDDLKKGHESYVPKNGIMLDNYKAVMKSKSTVYDLLKKACDDNNIPFTAKTTTYSIYIVGINNIDEFDCGKQSGWMYTVNGKYPNVSADSKRLKDGDKVVFTYTCSYKN